jgi:hypothetical protein
MKAVIQQFDLLVIFTVTTVQNCLNQSTVTHFINLSLNELADLIQCGALAFKRLMTKLGSGDELVLLRFFVTLFYDKSLFPAWQVRSCWNVLF